MLRFSLILSAAVALVHSTCVLKENKDNILASRLEGAWVVDEDVTDIIAPSTYETFGIRELIITRDESSLENISDSYCEEFDEVPFYITGKAEATTFENETLVYDFGLTTYNGNPWLTYRLPGGEVEGAYTMMAVAEDRELDTWFFGTYESGAPMAAFSRQD